MAKFIISPQTGRKVKIGGKSYRQLVRSGVVKPTVIEEIEESDDEIIQEPEQKQHKKPKRGIMKKSVTKTITNPKPMKKTTKWKVREDEEEEEDEHSDISVESTTDEYDSDEYNQARKPQKRPIVKERPPLRRSNAFDFSEVSKDEMEQLRHMLTEWDAL